MNRRIAILAGLLTFFCGASLRGETDEEVEAHKLVLDITGAFTNDGFKLRDGHWTGMIKPIGRYLVEPAGDGSRVTLNPMPETRGVGSLLAPLMALMVKRLNRQHLDAPG